MDVENEKCNCKSEFPIVLQHQLTKNAIVCSNCNLDRELNFSHDQNEEINSWNQNYSRVYKIWLESENTIRELTNPSSSLNKQGFKITLELNTFILTYYWWHVDKGKVFTTCPKCEDKLLKVENEYSGFHKVCDKCKILINE